MCNPPTPSTGILGYIYIYTPVPSPISHYQCRVHQQSKAIERDTAKDELQFHVSCFLFHVECFMLSVAMPCLVGPPRLGGACRLQQDGAAAAVRFKRTPSETITLEQEHSPALQHGVRVNTLEAGLPPKFVAWVRYEFGYFAFLCPALYI